MDQGAQYGVTTLYEPAHPDDVLYDLVAVHGLNGDAFGTWTHKQSGVLWLRDLLPKELPNLRIMTYGYNAKFRNFTGHQDLRNIAMKLLSELADLRKTGKELSRPVVFVCHSLGGIVVKKALLIRCPEEQTRVQNATYGIIFLATPHSGSAVANNGRAIANIIQACSPFRPARGLLGSLRKDSKVLFEITEDFVAKLSNLQIVSFFEMEMTSFGIFKRLVVEQRSAILNVPNEIPIGQFADHRDIARFSSTEDRNYRPVITRLLKFRQDITKQLASITSSSRSAESPKGDLESIFEVPFDKCVSFRGRERLLETMETYFNQSSRGKPLVYALTGLGGAGKTHSALQYALRNRFKYTNGVVYFDASSNTTLIADFHRVYDLLGLGSASNKVDFLRQWFSKPKHHNWLMIFDGADDLESVRLSRYFPSCSWGHIIVTSRDQAAVGLVAPAGQAIEPLEEQAAIGLLLEKAALSVPSLDDIKQATTIVRSLGCLPLAVDQAGAFIRRRGKSLKDYHRLFENKQYEVLNITPGISGYEKTVATAWELNFRQLEKDATEASHLLILFSFLEAGKISESMLLRGCSPKKVWGRNGEVAEVSPDEAGLDSELVTLLNNEMQLDNAIEQLLAFSLIERTNSVDERRAFSVHPLVQHCASNRVPLKVREKWRAQAILLVAHAFPFNVYIDEDFGNVGREMFAHVPRILKEFDQLGPDCGQYSRVKQALCVLLLSASRFNYNPWKQQCIHRIKGLLNDKHDCYLKAQAAFTESKFLRMQGKVADSYKALEEHIHRTVLPGLDEELGLDARWNATQGDLIISFSENLIRENDLERAQAELEEWHPLAPTAPSTMEKIVLQSRNVMLGRVLKNQGRFHEALPYFEKLLLEFSHEDYRVSTGWQMALFSNVADLYCEVGRPDDAEAVLAREMEIIYARGWQNISTGRRLQLALIESFIRRGMFKKAEECLWKLVPIFEAITEPDMIQNTGHFRVWAGLARVSHLQGDWDDALVRWYRALSIVEGFGWTEGFNHGIILFSIAQVLTRTGNLDKCNSALENARKSLAAEERKYWIVGLGSYWYDYVVTSLGEAGPSPVVMQSKQTNDLLIN